MCPSKKVDTHSWHNKSFIMLSVTTQGSHSEFLTTVLSLSHQDWSPVLPTTVEGQVQALTEVSDLI